MVLERLDDSMGLEVENIGKLSKMNRDSIHEGRTWNGMTFRSFSSFVLYGYRQQLISQTRRIRQITFLTLQEYMGHENPPIQKRIYATLTPRLIASTISFPKMAKAKCQSYLSPPRPSCPVKTTTIHHAPAHPPHPCLSPRSSPPR